MSKAFCSLIFLFAIIIFSSSAQTTDHSKLDSFAAKMLTKMRGQSGEKAYVVTDKDIYQAGDFVWLRAFVLNNLSHRISTGSKYVFADVVNESDSVFAGILLDATHQQLESRLRIPAGVATGNYWVRTYTPSMLAGDGLNTAVHGIYIVNAADENGKKKRATAATTGDPEIAFFPEGGTLMTAVQTKIAFAVSINDSIPVQTDVSIIDDNKAEVTHFQTDENGLGSVTFEPHRRRTYQAVFNYNGKGFSYPLPPFNFYAGQISVTRPDENWLLKVLLEDSIYSEKFRSYLIGISGDSLFFAAIGQGQFQVSIPDSKFPPGIATFFLFDSAFRLLSERSIYVKNHLVQLMASPGQASVRNRGRQTIIINLQDEKAQPLNALYTVSVVDSIFTESSVGCRIPGLYRAGKSLVYDNFYLAQMPCLSDAAMDVLMLTRPSTNLDAFPQRSLPMEADSFMYISGRVMSDKNDPLANSVVILMAQAGNGTFTTDTTDNKGRFVFPVSGYADSSEFTLSVQGNGRTNAIFQMDPQRLPAFKTPAALRSYDVAEDQLRKIRSRYLEPWMLTHTANRLPPVKVTTTTKSFDKRVSQYSRIIDGDKLRDGDDVGNAVLNSGGVHKVNGFLVMGGPTSMSGVTGSSEPLIITNGSPAPMGAGQGVNSPALSYLSSINPREVEFIEVLKGADAANYGVRGGNGVILVNLRTSRKSFSNTGSNATTIYPHGPAKPYIFPAEVPVKDEAQREGLPDNRSTIFWDGSVLTGKEQSETFTFSTTDTQAVYKVIVRGVTAGGDILYTTATFQSKGE